MSERQPSRYDWIMRSQDEEDVFFVEHPECSGRFRMHKPSFGRDMELESVKSALLGTPYPTKSAEVFAEWAATIQVGFVEGPTCGEAPELKLEDVMDVKLISGIYSEVAAYWATFRPA